MAVGSADAGGDRAGFLPSRTLLDAVVEQAVSEPRRPEEFDRRRLIAQFFSEDSLAERLSIWLGSDLEKCATRKAVVRRLGHDLATLDSLICDQVNAILHHPEFQQLEATWRGLWFLTGRAEQAKDLMEQDAAPGRLQIKVLNISKRELYKDLDGAVEFDQSVTFQKVYESEFGIAGGEPYGVLLGDYYFSPHPDDVRLLEKMSEVAAAAFAPFISAADAAMFDLDDLAELDQPLNISATFNQLRHLKWRAFRENHPDSRFVGLTLPRILMRQPYEDDGLKQYGFRFREDVAGTDRRKYVWGNAAYAFTSVLMRAFADSSWFGDVRGVRRGVLGGGLVEDLEVHCFSTDSTGVALKTSTEVALSEKQESELSDLGFVPLLPCKDTEFSVFYTTQSVQKPKQYDDPKASASARLSAMLHYILCTSRFAHYLKVLARDKIGGFASAEIETLLNRWIQDYVTPDENAPPEIKAKFPLQDAQVSVEDVPGQPGSYSLTIRLCPHFQLDQMVATVKLVAKLVSSKGT